MSDVGTPMPQYQCHKKVWALKVAAIEVDKDGSAKISPVEKRFAPFTTGPKFRFTGSESDLGYYVRYEDGFESWSPTKAFEDGYKLI